MMANEIRFIELFGGVGGFRKGIEQGWESIKSRQHLSKQRRAGSGRDRPRTIPNNQESEDANSYERVRCVGYYEIDKYATGVYNHQFKEEYRTMDITTVRIKDIQDHDILTAGFPCQSFSIAGKRRGFKDTRGTLFFEICKIASAKRPSFLFLENVQGLLSHDNGETFRVIIESLDELGYDAEWQVLNSKHFGVPQSRKRVFIVGHLRSRGFRQIFPITEATRSTIKTDSGEERGQEQASGNILQHSRDESGKANYNRRNIAGSIKAHRSGNQENFVELPKTASCLDANYHKGINKGNKVNRTVVPVSYRTRTYKNQPGQFELRNDDVANQLTTAQKDSMVVITHNLQTRKKDRPSLRNGTSKGGSGYIHKKDETCCLDSSMTQAVEIMGTVTEATGNRAGTSKEFVNAVDKIKQTTGLVRRLTPIEAERLQGFPDNWTQKMLSGSGKVVPVSDTQRYRMMGNAVTVNVIQRISEELLVRI
jgi:DNA (cytosine-5)-methyltransferase 1